MTISLFRISQNKCLALLAVNVIRIVWLVRISNAKQSSAQVTKCCRSFRSIRAFISPRPSGSRVNFRIALSEASLCTARASLHSSSLHSSRWHLLEPSRLELDQAFSHTILWTKRVQFEQDRTDLFVIMKP